MTGGLIDLGGLTKPATILIEKISDAVGGLAKPWQIERLSRAEARSKIIQAEADIEVSEIEKRAIRRLVSEEGKKQKNIEDISFGAIPLLKEDAKPEDISEDWISHFFERSRLTSDRQMQAIWSSILAGQANSPGAFSRKTVDLVATLEQSDAKLLNKLAKCVIYFGAYDKAGNAVPGEYDPKTIIFDYTDDTGEKYWNFGELNHLVNMGFIQCNFERAFGARGMPGEISFDYGSDSYCMNVGNDFPITIEIGNVVLTMAGLQLIEVIGREEDINYFDRIVSFWSGYGYVVSRV